MKRYISYPRVAGVASRQAHADLPPGTYEREMSKDGFFGPEAAEALRLALMTTEPTTVRPRPYASTAPLTTQGQATGVLLGGNLRSIGQSVGWGPTFAGAILLLEAVDMMPGEMDGLLTQLLHSGVLVGLHGVAV